MYKIAISGKASSGKNTLAKIIASASCDNATPHNFMAFADPIKEIIMLMFPNAKRECLFGSSKLRSEIIPNAFKDGEPLSYRQALIDIGTRAREYNNVVWVDNFHKRWDVWNKNHSEPNLVVVTDVRFREEFDYLKSNKFFIIRLSRCGKSVLDDVSETKQESILDNEFDYIINNDKSLKDLREKVVNELIPHYRDHISIF